MSTQEEATVKLAYTIKEFMAVTGIKRSAFHEERAAGRLKVHHRGRTILIMADEVARYLASLPEAPLAKPYNRKRQSWRSRPLIDICMEIDRLDEEAGEMVDRTSEEFTCRKRQERGLFVLLGYRSADSIEVIEWREKWLTRAIENEWSARRLNNMRRCVARDRKRFRA